MMKISNAARSAALIAAMVSAQLSTAEAGSRDGVVDQAKLGNAAGNEVRPSRLVMFGNPALGTTFITANPLAGLDWPVRVLVYQATDGSVYAAYTDFDWIAKRHRISNRKGEFAMASQVIKAVTDSVRK